MHLAFEHRDVLYVVNTVHLYTFWCLNAGSRIEYGERDLDVLLSSISSRDPLLPHILQNGIIYRCHHVFTSAFPY